MTSEATVSNNPQAAGVSRIVIAPNCSLSPSDARLLVAGVGGISLAIAMVFAWRGFWPILPFAGAEIALLAWAVRHSMRRGGYREVLTVDEQTVTLERGLAGPESRDQFSRHWLRPRLEQGRWQECRVLLVSHGNGVEVGACLTSEEKKALFRRLCQLLGRTT